MHDAHSMNIAEAHTFRASLHDLSRFESLERRVLLAGDLTFIQWFEADDRGNVVLQMSQALDGNTVNSSSVQILLAGPDGLLGTADDIVADVVVSYDSLTNQIIIDGDFDQSTRYAIRVDGDQIRDFKGDFIDAEFMGMGNETGDGVAGGEFLVFTRPPAEDLIARIETVFGNIDIILFRETTPVTVANFLNYAQSGRYDETFFHRLVEDFVLQGGGFLADEDFTAIDTDPPIINEFNLSNLFGTIAMAKLGGDPNSATSQFFFNLADNSENLDNQNGGFTVFGEITPESFDVLAALAGLTTVNATGQGGGAFSEVPVVDPDAVDGDLTRNDLVVITRVSILQDVSGQPYQQLGTENTEVFSSNFAGNTSKVYIYDLDGLNTGNISDFVRVIFSPNSNAVQSIVIYDGFEGRIGISIADANSVGVIHDLRTTQQGQLAFIASNAVIGSIFLRQSVVGMDLAGFTLAGGIQIDEDPARTGRPSNNLLGLYVEDSFVGSVTILGNVEADIVLEGGTRLIRVIGQTTNADFRIGIAGVSALPNPPAVTNLVLGSVDNAGVSSAIPLGLVQATNWTNSDADIASIVAPTIQRLFVLGNPAQNLPGDLEANVRLTGANDSPFSLISAFVRGTVFGSEWDIQGNTNLVQFNGGIINTTANFAGDLRNFLVGGVVGSTIDIAGDVITVRAFDWQASFLTAQGAVRNFLVLSNPAAGLAGNFSGEVVLNNSQSDIPTFRVQVNGEATGSIAVGGNMYNAYFVGNTDDFTFIGGRDFWNVYFYGSSNETTVEAININGVLRTGEFTEGRIGTNNLNRWVSLGSVSGDMELREAVFIAIYGDASFELFSNRVGTMHVLGNVSGSVWNFEGTATSGTSSIGTLYVRDAIQDSVITADRNIGSITATHMFNSELYVGAPEGQFGLPDSPDGMNLDATIGSIRITGIAGAGIDSFVNSFIVAGRIDTAFIFRPQTSNFGTPFGIAAGSIGRITTVFPTFTVDRMNPASILPQGDYQVRIGFAVPA